jgi:hypothetical protein
MDKYCATASVSTFCERFGRFSSFDRFPEAAIDYLAAHFFELPTFW